MAALALAIERKQWELAALYLLLGVVQAAGALPPEAVEGLLDVLEEPARERRGARRGPRR